MIIALLGAIAAGWSYIEVHEAFLRRDGPARIDEQAKTREIADSVAARSAVGREAPALFSDLGGVDEKTDWRLAALAGQVPEFASSADVIVERMRGLTDNACLQAALDLTEAMIAGTATSFVVDAAAAHLGTARAMWANELSGLRPDRRARIVTEALFEDGFDETQVAG
jgi:hypothetical protein